LAFGDGKITQQRIAKALATYQLTFTSRKSDFDYFMEGNSKRLSDQQIEGLHIFRTKGRCMNCHHDLEDKTACAAGIGQVCQGIPSRLEV